MECIVCDSSDLQLKACSNYTFSSNGKVDYCKSCESFFLRRFPDVQTLDKFYSLEESNQQQHLSGFFKSLRMFQQKLRTNYINFELLSLLGPYLNRSKKGLICGSRNIPILRQLKKRGYDFSVLEPSQFYRKKIQQQTIFLEEEIHAELFFKEKFDFCLMPYFLQFVTDPVKFVRLIHESLAPQGKLVGLTAKAPADLNSLPDTAKLNIFNRDILVHYSKKGLEDLLGRAGFSKVQVKEEKIGCFKPNTVLLFSCEV